MEDFSSCTKRKYSDITQELASSPSSFSSSSSTNSSMNQFLSSLDNQQSPQYFSSQPSMNDLYSPVTQITNTNIQQLSSSLVNSHINSNTQNNKIAHITYPTQQTSSGDTNTYDDRNAILTQALPSENSINSISQAYQQQDIAPLVTNSVVPSTNPPIESKASGQSIKL
jgi:hypothetical protein